MSQERVVITLERLPERAVRFVEEVRELYRPQAEPSIVAMGMAFTIGATFLGKETDRLLFFIERAIKTGNFEILERFLRELGLQDEPIEVVRELIEKTIERKKGTVKVSEDVDVESGSGYDGKGMESNENNESDEGDFKYPF